LRFNEIDELRVFALANDIWLGVHLDYFELIALLDSVDHLDIWTLVSLDLFDFGLLIFHFDIGRYEIGCLGLLLDFDFAVGAVFVRTEPHKDFHL
jgi:hypothetical protein